MERWQKQPTLVDGWSPLSIPTPLGGKQSDTLYLASMTLPVGLTGTKTFVKWWFLR